MHIDLEKVPTRQKNMKAWELLLSESQERMLLVAKKGQEDKIKKVFEKWDLPCSEIGYVTDDGRLKFYLNGELEADVPAAELVLGGGAPQYDREYSEPTYLEKVRAFNIESVQDVTSNSELKEIASSLISSPNIAAKTWITRQYDSMVGTANMSTNAPSDAAIVLAKGTGKALAMTTDCNGRYVFADPYHGAMIAVAEAARNIVCSGGNPIGVTNCLNFGNPYNPEVYYQFVKAVTGMGDACRKFETPVTGGNVSFYNQNPEGPIYPTPTIGMVGILDDVETRMTLDFKSEGDVIYLVGKQRNDIGSSEYIQKIRKVEYSNCPHFDLDVEFHFQHILYDLIQKKDIIVSAHDLSEGGLIVALLESGFNRGLGFDVVEAEEGIRTDAYWLGETQSRAIVSISSQNASELESTLNKANVFFTKLGAVTSGEIKVNGESWGNISEWKTPYVESLDKEMA